MSDMSFHQGTTSGNYFSQFADKQKEIELLLASFEDGKPPDSALSKALNNMILQWNSFLSQTIIEVDHTQPIPEHIKETAEFEVKQFRDACLEINSEFTRVSINWQLKNQNEMAVQEIKDYEIPIQRQNNLLDKIKEKIDGEIISTSIIDTNLPEQ